MNNEKPEIVKKALLLLWIVLGIGIVRSILELSESLKIAEAQGFGSGAVYFITIFTMSFMAILFYLIGRRKNWARWVFVILFVLGTPLSVNPLIQSLKQFPISGALGLLQVVAQIVAGVLLFLAPARAWFKRQS